MTCMSSFIKIDSKVDGGTYTQTAWSSHKPNFILFFQNTLDNTKLPASCMTTAAT
jgi:hypothetical protein